jgi:hypothetical protein
MVVALTGSALLIAAMQSAAPSGAAIDLFCRGNGDRFVTTQTKVRQVDGSVKTLTNSGRIPFTSAIRIKVANGTGQALIPNEMLADDDPRGWHAIKKLAVTNESVNGKVYFNWLFSPVMSLDRRSGVLRINGSMANFTGRCTAYDPRTSRMPPPARRPSQPGGYASGPSGTPPGGYGNDSRSAARAMAGRANARDSARSAAIKADLAFRLFNASNLAIVEVVMVGPNGVASKNWLRAGERVAPQAFRAMNFATAKTCNHKVRITYADGSRAFQPINFCGKDILFASGRDVWAE